MTTQLQLNLLTNFKIKLLFGAMLLLAGCGTIPTTAQRLDNLHNIAKTSKEFTLNTSLFTLYGLENSNMQCYGKTLNLYIEGDGLAWVSKNRVSNDPTPINPIGAKLFKSDPSSCKIYLARPCQYIKSSSCSSEYWTNRRFSSEVINSYNTALDRLKTKYNNSSFNLIGYSGGGAVATLLASRRYDISNLVTIAGNLDTKLWTKYHHIEPLNGSLNPKDVASSLSSIKQYHLVGSSDNIIPKVITDSYCKASGMGSNIKVLNYNFSHNGNWQNIWRGFVVNFINN